MDLIWNHDGVPGLSNFILAVCFGFAFVAARFILDRFIFRRVAILLLSRGTTLKINTETKKKIVKCSESMWKFTYYAAVEFGVLISTYHEPWFTDIKEYFRGWPDQELKFFRIGIVVLALHDASDVFMEAAKVFKYSEREFGASLFFGLFALTWFMLRLIYFPFWVIRASNYHLIEFLDLSETYNMVSYYIFNTMLLTLLIFHIYWWILVFSMITRQLKNRGKVGEDIRSDSEDD